MEQCGLAYNEVTNFMFAGQPAFATLLRNAHGIAERKQFLNDKAAP
jgi:hypothetical protein